MPNDILGIFNQIKDTNVRFSTVCYNEFALLICSTSQVALFKPHAF
ncbi:hypothetical protein [Bacillus sp. FSL K6-0067]|nr:hypothetical protein [Bacillus cereus]